MIRIRFVYPTGSTLGYSIERMSDGKYWDFTNSIFAVSPATMIASLPEQTGSFLGSYRANLTTPALQFTDGGYTITVHDLTNGNAVIYIFGISIHGADDEPVFPAVSGAAVLDSTGLDSVEVENGINARQALSIILAGSVGSLDDNTTNLTIGYAPIGSAPQRFQAVRNNRNRTVTVTPPT